MCESNVTWIDSACPVVPEHTSMYVGFSVWPPEYPETTDTTPSINSKTASTHQKHPPARVIVSIFLFIHPPLFALDQESLNETVLLKTNVFELEDLLSKQKYPSLSN